MGLRNKYAGWYVGIMAASQAPKRCLRHRPRKARTGSSVPSKCWLAVPPRVRMILGAVNSNQTLSVDTNFRIRFEVQETNAGVANNVAFTLEFDHESAGFTPITATTPLQWATSTHYAHGDDTTQQIASGFRIRYPHFFCGRRPGTATGLCAGLFPAALGCPVPFFRIDDHNGFYCHRICQDLHYTDRQDQRNH